MKTSTITFAILLVSTVAFSQNLSVSSYMERTVVGSKVGTSVGYSSKSGIEYGGFYQRAVDGATPEGATKWNFEQQFYGAFFTYPVISGNFFNLGFNVRTGVSNGENFVITPSLLSSISPIKSIKLGAGIGVRALRPTIQARVTIRLNGGIKERLFASK